MKEVLLFAVLGLGAGAAYAILAQGVVLEYKGSGVVNFAQAAIAMFSAFGFTALVNGGVSKYVALVIVLILAAVGGVAIFLLIMRPLATAPALARVVAMLGIFIALPAAASLIWGSVIETAPSILPARPVSLFGGVVSSDRLYLLAVAVATSTALWALYRFTLFGRVTRAAAENERGLALLGFSPGLVAASNWALGSTLGALAGILIAPISGLGPELLTLLIVPALAAALFGRLTFFGITTAAAVAIGVGQSLLTNYWDAIGVEEALPFVILILTMAVAGRGIPLRGTLTEGRPPTSLSGAPRVLPIAAGLIVLAVLMSLLDTTYKLGIATSLCTAIIVLSLTVVTGYVGQISLTQATFAGLGGFAAGKFAALGLPFPLPLIAAALVGLPIGVIVGLPALRVRGIQLAIVTLGASVAINAVLFGNPAWSGGQNGVPLPTIHMFGLSLEPFTHPVRFVIFSLVVLSLVALAVSNLRRSPSGRRMLAVRDNERAAAAVGINVAATKLQAFALASSIAAIGGGMIGYLLGNVSFTQYAPLQSVTFLTIAYIGGIATISGAMIGGAIASGGVLYVALSGISSISSYYMLVTGVALIFTVIVYPDGAAVMYQRFYTKFVAALRRRGDAEAPTLS